MDNKNYISTHWVPSEVGEQLKFAVPSEGENIDDTVYVDSSYNVNMVDEIREEIIEFLNSNRDMLVDNRFISKVEKIFGKY